MTKKYLSVYICSVAIIPTLLVTISSVYAESGKIPLSSPVSEVEVRKFREQGPEGLQSFLKQYQTELESTHPEAYQMALDEVCQQKNCYASRLYWYTDLDQAKAVAKKSNKPILSLRLLGKLSEDLSCANSRFFRVALYPNAQISQFLKDHYVLHWESVRPVPKMTIDFGDGRVLKRTITGNSIHYILSADGQVIDALPGMYGPQNFLQNLQDSAKFAVQLYKTDFAKRNTLLQQHYRNRITTLQENWKKDLGTIGVKLVREFKKLGGDPTAAEAGMVAMSKMRVESPLLWAVMGNHAILSQKTDDAAWLKLAQLHKNDAILDQNSIRLIYAKLLPHLESAVKSPEAAIRGMIEQFQESMALDTVRNTYSLQHQMYGWLVVGETGSLNELNDRVYRESFLMPLDDPFLGLRAPAYSGIDGDGI